MIDILMIIAFFVLMIAMLAAPILLVIKFQAYKAKKYYKLLGADFDLDLSNEKSGFFGVEGTHMGCRIQVANHSFKNSREISGVRFSKQLGVKISVHNQSLSNINFSLTSLKKVSKSDKFNLNTCNEYFDIKIPTSKLLNDDLIIQLFETACKLGIEDRFDIVQNENGALEQIQSFPLVNKKRYLKCKATISLLINLNSFLLEKHTSNLSILIKEIKDHKEKNMENRINELYKLMEKSYVGKSNRPFSSASIEAGGEAFYLIVKIDNHPTEVLFGLKTWQDYKHNQYIYLFPFGIDRTSANTFLKSILGNLIYFDEDGPFIDPIEFDQVVAKLKPFEVSGALE